MTPAIRRLFADARIYAPDELAELPALVACAGLAFVVLAVAWVMLP